jgi:hypothetical protein
MKYLSKLTVVTALLVIASTFAEASPTITYDIGWQVTSSGGKSSGGAFRLQQAIGQTAAGYSDPATRRVNSGFEQALSASGCCVGLTGNVDCDLLDGVDISDLTRLIDYLYITFAPLCCPGEANTDGDLLGGVDISDLTALIDYLYISFTPTADCQ